MAKVAPPAPSEVLTVLRQLCGSSPQAQQRVERAWYGCLNEMLTLYYPICTAIDESEMLANVGIACRAYVNDLGDYSQAEIEEAWRLARRPHRTQRWPTIQDILQHLPESPTGAQPVIAAHPADFPSETHLEKMRQSLAKPGLSKFTDLERRQWVAYATAFVRVINERPDQRPTIDPDGKWGDDALIAEAIRFYRIKLGKPEAVIPVETVRLPARPLAYRDSDDTDLSSTLSITEAA